MNSMNDLNSALPEEISIRNARVEDAESIFGLLKHEEPKWPHSYSLMCSLLDMYPGCGQMAVTEEEDICGIGFGIPTDDNEGYIATIVVKRELRRQGIGKTLLRHCISYLGNRNMFIFSTSCAFGMHLRRGFRLDSGKLEVRSGKISHDKIPKVGHIDGLEIEDLKKTSLRDLIEYDRSIQSTNREWFYRRFLRSSDDLIGQVASIDTQVVGFAYVLVSPPHKPVLTIYADTPLIARVVLRSLCKKDIKDQGEDWVLVMPHDNKEARALIRPFGLTLDGVLSPMYTDHSLSIAWKNIYATHCINFNNC